MEGANLEDRDWTTIGSSARVRHAIIALPIIVRRLKNEQANPHHPLRRK